MNEPIKRDVVFYTGVGIVGVLVLMAMFYLFSQDVPPPRVSAPVPTPVPTIETELYHVGEGIACVVVKQGTQILASGCLK